MIRKIREAREEEGFTLIELLVVVIIIGILAAIAIPVFLNQRKKAWDSAMKSDLRNAAVIQETNFTENGTYLSTAALLNDAGAKNSDKVTFTSVSGDATDYCITAAYDGYTTRWQLKGSVGKPVSGDATLAC